MKQGEIFAERFQIKAFAGRGGMGRVYQAYDQHEKNLVAVKILHTQSTRDIYRFQREAKVLSEIIHPHIVRYIAHGQAETGEYYLVMEWLEGEILSKYLSRTSLSLSESITLLTKVSQALAILHQKGVTHRDIKPSNLFLVDGSVENVTLLDFGIARLTSNNYTITHTGTMLGSPGYIAPEQAKGSKTLSPSADIFSLGCVLFHCLTGRPAFVGENLIAVLAKLLLEEVPKASTLQKNLPEALDLLLMKMLSKEPENRPANGTKLLQEIKEQQEALHRLSSPPEPTENDQKLTEEEQRLLCVLLVTQEAHLFSTDTQTPTFTPNSSRNQDEKPLTSSTTLPTLTKAESDTLLQDQLFDTVSPYGGNAEILANDSAIVTFFGTGVATDQAAQAARCALDLQTVFPQSTIALSTGRAKLKKFFPIGDVIDRAARMLQSAKIAKENVQSTIQIDETTAGLIGSRFEVGGEQNSLLLYRERKPDPKHNTLLGYPSPLVGRVRELDRLLSLFSECAEESAVRPVLITAPAGFGKSRLCHEFLQKLSFSHRIPSSPQAEDLDVDDTMPYQAPSLEVFSSNADPIRAGSSFGILSRGIRRACGIQEGESLRIQQKKLRARLGRHWTHEKENLASFSRALSFQQTLEFLGELTGVRFPAEKSVQLTAARQDALLLGDQMQRALETWLTMECKAGPVLWVIEDLHWGDLPSIKFLDTAMRLLHNLPFMILALARPEIRSVFPRLWQRRSLNEIRLPPLSKRACEQLIKEVLQEKLSETEKALLIHRAGGNAFYLEECIRAAMQGNATKLPATVLAMIQSRIESLPTKARRVLRAASIFGQRFFQEGVRTLLGGTQESRELSKWLSQLIEQEIILEQSERTFPQEPEYSFRHSLFRDGAYAMLTPNDKSLGHRLAAEWLSQKGERDAILLAEHFERGEEPEKSIPWYVRAAEQALEGNDMTTVLSHVKRGLACGATGEEFGLLCAFACEAHIWRGENIEADHMGNKALKALSKGSPMWCKLVGGLFTANAQLGNHERLLSLVEALRKLDPKPESLRFYVMSAGIVILFLNIVGISGLSEKLLERIALVTKPLEKQPPSIKAWSALARCYHEELSQGQPWSHLQLAKDAQSNFELAGDLRSKSVALLEASKASRELGAFENAIDFAQKALSLAKQMGLYRVAASARCYLAICLGLTGQSQKAQVQIVRAVETFATQKNYPREGLSRAYFAKILLENQEIDKAEKQARLSIKILATILPGKAEALTTLSQILLMQNRNKEALQAAKESFEILEELGMVGYGKLRISLVYLEALFANQEEEIAKKTLKHTYKHLLDRANAIKNPDIQKSFLQKVPEHTRILSLAKKFLSIEPDISPPKKSSKIDITSE